jgi:hypothetical protein
MRKAILIFLCGFAFLSSASRAAPASAQKAPHDLSIVLLIGQSNMSGRGAIGPQDRVAIPRVFALNAAGQWGPAIDPLHWDKPKAAGVGPGREFAHVLANARPGTRIGLVPAAVGGSSLEQWQPGGNLYNQALARLRMALKSGTLVAILWHQGETEANKADRAANYATRWVTMMKQLRTDAGAPRVPVVAGELGEFLKRPYAHVVNAQLDSLPDLLDNVAVASAKGLQDRGDGLHFDAASQREFGRRYARALLMLTGR